MSDVATLTIEQVQAGLAARQFSARELAQSALDFAQAENPKTNAYLHFLSGTRSGRGRTRGSEAGRGRKCRTAGGRPDRGEGRDRHQRRSHHLRLAAAGTLHPALRCHCGEAFGTGRRGNPRKNKLRRVRHGFFERKLRVRTGSQSRGSRPRTRWIERRLGGGSSAGNGRRGARLRHRRVSSTAGFVLRRGGRHAHLWPRLALRADRLCQFARSHRTVWENGARRGAVARNHGRPRRMRCNVRLRPRAPLTPRNWTAKWPAPGSACRANISRAYRANRATASGAPSRCWKNSVAKCATSACPPPNTPCPATTSSPRPKPVRTSLAMTACATPRAP